MKNYKIEKMSYKDLSLALQWENQAGVNTGLYDADCFFRAYQNDFFVGKLEEEIIAFGSAVIYDDEHAFCGFYMVKPEYRGQGYGFLLTEARLAHVQNRCTGLNGVMSMAKKYENIGYQAAYKNIHYMTNMSYLDCSGENIIDLSALSFEEINQFDQQYFFAPRSDFLKRWIYQPEAISLGYKENNLLRGYGVIRKCISGYKIGPLFAQTEQIADSLFGALISRATQPFYIDAPQSNHQMARLIKKYQLQEYGQTLRMYRNKIPNENLDEIYGITSLELG